jgi:hypothetical protein
MRVERFWKGERELALLCGIKGLIRDGDDLKATLEEISPEVVYVSIAPEEVDGLRNFLTDPFEMNLSDYEILYGVALSRYGEVMTPPPIYIETIKYCEIHHVKAVGIDYDEEKYEQMYNETVRPRDLFFHSMRKRSIGRKRFPQETPEEFVQEWEKAMTKNKRMAMLEINRLNHMMETFLHEFPRSDAKRSALVMEFEKCFSCSEILREEGFNPSR